MAPDKLKYRFENFQHYAHVLNEYAKEEKEEKEKNTTDWSVSFCVALNLI